MNGNDEDLHDRFAALRREEGAQAPEFARLFNTREERVRRWSPAHVAAAAVCLAITIATALLLVHGPWRPQQGQRAPVASITAWKSPTDFLLETPGSELLRPMPELGFSRVDAKAPAPENKNRQAKRKVLP
jgi:hypothetical protein